MVVKYMLEYPVNCSPGVLYPFINSPGGLAEWFADNVRVEGKFYTFFWNGTEQKAEVLHLRENYFIRFRWIDNLKENTYFEFRILTGELTHDTTLLITDFVEENEKQDAIELWNSQVSRLKHCVGV